MTLGELKLESLRLIDEDESYTSSNVSEHIFNKKMLGAINRGLRRLYDKDKLPLTTALITDSIVINDTEQGYIFNGLPYSTLDTKALAIPQYILEVLVYYVAYELKKEDDLGKANDLLNKYEIFASELATPKINSTTRNRQTKITSTYNVNKL